MKTGIAKVGYAMETKDENGKVTYGPVRKLESNLSGGREFTAAPQGEATDIYADGGIQKAVSTNAGYEITLTLLDIIDDVHKDWLDNKVDAVTGGVAEYAGSKQLPTFCLVLAEETDDGTGRVTFYYSTNVTKRPEKTSKTSEGKFEAQFPKFTLKAKPREDKLICYEMKASAIPDQVVFPAGETPPDNPEAAPANVLEKKAQAAAPGKEEKEKA